MRHLWNHFEVYIASMSLALLVVMLAIQASARYLFHIGLPWTEEISRFAFIFFVYSAASLAVLRGTHIKVEIFLSCFSESIRRNITFVSNLVQIAFFLTASFAGTNLVLDMIEFPVYSPSLLLPLYYIYAVIPLSYFLMAVRLVQRMLHTPQVS